MIDSDTASNLLAVVLPLALAFASFYAAVYAYQRHTYNKSNYFAITQNSYRKVMRDKGLRGEYRTASRLEKVPGNKKILLNLYVPKGERDTTEIDVVLIHASGIYVLESKYYSGWIFGSEGDKMWTQTFPSGRKERFYNPIKQNQAHIRCLRNYLGQTPDIPYHSIIVFSGESTLKKIKLTTSEHVVVTRRKLPSAVSAVAAKAQPLSDETLGYLYAKLWPLTQVSPEQKTAHIQRLQSKHGR
ncbi:MAG: NERD domain-containing protein [Propionibacteriaceae bacterium]|jgi:hypothetical protein|nr:NERD domain-containing protein [Propionibacteriaceae bacterium]